MKITHITTQNFLGARAVDIAITSPVTLFCGKNFSGKSSVQEAVRMALTGESVRVPLKKDYGQIITVGQDAGFAEVEIDGIRAFVTLPTGKTTPLTEYVPPAALPYVLDAQRFAAMTSNERRVFLFGLMNIKTDGATVRSRLVDKGCDSAKVEVIMPILRAGFDAAQKESAGKAREAKGGWKTATGGETYGSQKAATWRAAAPQSGVNVAGLEQARADLAQIEREIESQSDALGELRGRAKQVAEQSGKLEALREKAGRYARVQDKLNRDEAELKEWEVTVAETREKASGEHRMQSGLVCPHCAGIVMMDNGALIEYASPTKKADPDAVTKLPEYENALKLMQSAVANGKRDLAEANAAAEAIKQLEEGAVAAPSKEEISALSDRIETLKHGRGNQQAAIRLLEETERHAADSEKRTTQAARHHADVQSWEKIADALAPDGIPGEMLAEALQPINQRLEVSAGTSEWQQIAITVEMDIITARENRPYALLSESEKWRADAMIAEAISNLSGVKLLVLDRLDVLDLQGRSDLLYWLDTLASSGEIDSALVFGTLKGIPAQLPENVGAIWIENGVAGQLREAA